MVGEVAPVGGREQVEVGDVAGRDPAEPVGAAEDVGGVDGAGGERFGGAEV